MPYYFALADHKDLTLKPKIYYNENSVIQAEYRHVTKRSKTILDASFNRGYKNTSSTKTDGSRNHFFLNSKINLDSEYFEESNAEINIQRTSNDTYLRVHNLQSELIKNNILLNSNLSFSFFGGKKSLITIILWFLIFYWNSSFAMVFWGLLIINWLFGIFVFIFTKILIRNQTSKLNIAEKVT